MIRFGLRLAAAGGREAATRLAVIAAAVALGTGLLLAALAGMNAVQSQNLRYAWLNTVLAETTTAPDTVDPVWWLLRSDYWAGQEIGRVDIAGTGPASPVPPGIPELPKPGEFYASPELSAALRATPADELGDRFPGREIGIIGADALPSPDSLLIVIGHAPEDLATLDDAVQVGAFMSTDPADCDQCHVGLGAESLTIALSVVAAALLVPVLMFIGTATRLTATRREERFAAMRLVGATPRQISGLAAVEATVAAVIGTAAGFGLFYALRSGLAQVPFTGSRFYPADLSLTWLDALAVAVGVPAGAAVVAMLGLRRVRISPLGVTRRVTPRPPRAWRLVPLALGVAELAWFIGRRPESTNGQLAAYLVGFVLILAGLMLAGPWLTVAGARLLSRHARRPAALIAGRRLAHNPQAGFRAVSGLVVALFVTSAATAVITTFVANRGAPPPGSVAAVSISKSFGIDPGPRAVPAGLAAVPGVLDVLTVRANPDDDPAGADTWRPGVIACTDLAETPGYGWCPPGAEVAGVHTDLIGLSTVDGPGEWPAAPVAAADLARLPMLSVVLRTDGTTAAIERARTALENAFPAGRMPATAGEFEAASTRSMLQFQQLAHVVILASLPIAGCSLAVAVAAGLADRRRPFSLLRLTGARLSMLRGVVALETAVPLLAVAVVATAVGFLAAALFLRAQLDYALLPPDAGYYVTVMVGLLLSLGIVATTLPLLRRITGPETARNE